MHTCRHFFRAILLTVSVVLCMVARGQNDLPLGDNLVVNGDFEQGNTGFVTDYTYTSQYIDDPGEYAVDNDVSNHYNNQGSTTSMLGQGHSGKYMMVNGSGNENDIVWQETIEVPSYSTFTFSVWVAHLWKSTGDTYKAWLKVFINGEPLNDDPFINDCSSASQRPNWKEFTAEWNSGNSTTATITIKDINPSEEAGNDFGLDDISLRGCQAENEEIVVSICESETYEWEGDTYSETGNYTKVFTNEDGCEYEVTLHLTVIPAPTVLITTDPETSAICEGESITIHAEGSIDRPAIGDILCTDNSVVKPSEWPVAGKTAKGIVFYVDESWQHGWAIGLNDSGQHRWCNAATLVAGLTNYTSPREAMYDFEGAENTRIIREAGSSTQFPAAWSVDIANDWYLPAIGQLRYLYANLYAVNEGLQTVDGTQFPVASSWSYWSSSQFDASKKWMLGSRGDVKEQTGTSTTVKIRAVCSF